MAPTDHATTPAAWPPELTSRLVEQMSRDAELVVGFLGAVGLGRPPGGVRCLPADFLLELGAACRLHAWELDGHTFHREAGLPSAGDAVVRVFRDAVARLADPSAPAPGPSLSLAVLELTIGRLVWTGPVHLRAEVLLDTPDEDALGDALARFLWARRHDPPASDPGATP